MSSIPILHHISTIGERKQKDFDSDLLLYAKSVWKIDWKYTNDFSGFLTKQGNGNYVKRWNKRWLVLKNDMLFYFKKKNDDDPLGVLFLDQSSIIQDYSKELDIPNAFGITVNSSCSLESEKSFEKRLYLFIADTERNLKDWFMYLHLACGKNLPYSPKEQYFPIPAPKFAAPPPPPSPLFSPPPVPVSSLEENLGRLSISASQISRDSPTRRSTVLNLTADSLTDFTLSRKHSSFVPPKEFSFDIRRISGTLSSVFMGAYQQIYDFINFVRTDLHENENQALGNYIEKGSNLVRVVRQLLYFVDGKYTKSIQNTDLTACLGRHMSIVIERCRKIAFTAKNLHEETEKTQKQKKELLQFLEELLKEIYTFVNITKLLSSLDEAECSRNTIFSFKSNSASVNLFYQLLDDAIDMANFFNSQNKEHYICQTQQLVSLTRHFITSFLNYRDNLASIYGEWDGTFSKWLLEKTAFEQLAIQLEPLRNELKTSAEVANDVWTDSQSDIYLMDHYFTLIFQLLKAAYSLAFLESRNEEQSSIFINFWNHFNAQQEESRKKKKNTLTGALSILLPQQTQFRDSGYRDETSSPIHPILEDIETSFIGSLGRKSLVQPTPASLWSHEGGDFRLLSPKAFNFLRNTPQKYFKRNRVQPEYTSMDSSTGDYLSSNYSVNQVVAKTIGDLSASIMEFSKRIQECFDHHQESQEITQIATSILNASQQIEEELGTLEGQSCPYRLIKSLEDKRQALLRASRCLELSIKSVQGFFIPAKIQMQVMSDLQSITDSCSDITLSIRAILAHQVSLLNQIQLPPTPVDMQSQIIFPMPELEEESLEEQQKKVELEAEFEVCRLLEEELEVFNNDPEILWKKESDGQKSIRGGTLEKLVTCLTHHILPRSDFTAAFLLTYRSFTTSAQLLDLLIKRYNMDSPSHLPENQRILYYTKKIIPAKLRVFNVLKMWVKSNYEDFKEDAELLYRLYEFLPTMRADFHKGTKEFQALLDRKAKGEEISYSQNNFNAAPSPIFPKSIKSLTLLDLDPLEVARQLTLYQWEIFQSIQPNECLNQSWNRPELHYLSPNIRKMIHYSNFIVQWVSSCIVQGETAKQRASLIKYFIILADRLKFLNNFDGLKSVLSGLETSGIQRLKKSWELLAAKYKIIYDDLLQLMSREKSSKNYRHLLHTINPPCIPFLGIYLTDLTMIETGNPNLIPDMPHLINFQKRLLVAQVIQEMKRYQCTPYHFVPLEPVRDLIENMPVKSVEEIYDISLDLEPRQPSYSQVTNASDETITTTVAFGQRRSSGVFSVLKTAMRNSSVSKAE